MGVSQVNGLTGNEQLLALVTSHQRRLAGFVRTLVPSRTDAEEVLQDVNLYIWRHAEEFESGTNFAAWALRIAHFHVLTWRKRQSRERLVFDDGLLERLSIAARSLDAQSDRHQEALDTCLAELANRDRELITQLYYEPGTTPRGLAKRIGRSTKGIYVSLNRIRVRLLGCIQRKLAAEDHLR